MMRPGTIISGLTILVWMAFSAAPATAHFGMVIPSDTMVMQDDSRTIHVTLSFSHPMERVGMELEKPTVFAVSANGNHQDLLGQLKPAMVMDHTAWARRLRHQTPRRIHVPHGAPSHTGSRPRTALSCT
jgi:cobalt/nickel transport protein